MESLLPYSATTASATFRLSLLSRLIDLGWFKEVEIGKAFSWQSAVVSFVEWSWHSGKTEQDLAVHGTSRSQMRKVHNLNVAMNRVQLPAIVKGW